MGSWPFAWPSTWRTRWLFLRFSSSSLSPLSTARQRCWFGLPRVFYFSSTLHIWQAFPYPPPGEAPDGRPVTPYGIYLYIYICIFIYLFEGYLVCSAWQFIIVELRHSNSTEQDLRFSQQCCWGFMPCGICCCVCMVHDVSKGHGHDPTKHQLARTQLNSGTLQKTSIPILHCPSSYIQRGAALLKLEFLFKPHSWWICVVFLLLCSTSSYPIGSYCSSLKDYSTSVYCNGKCYCVGACTYTLSIWIVTCCTLYALFSEMTDVDSSACVTLLKVHSALSCLLVLEWQRKWLFWMIYDSTLRLN